MKVGVVGILATLSCCWLGLCLDGENTFVLGNEFDISQEAIDKVEDNIKSKQGSVITPEHELVEWLGTHFVVEFFNVSDVELIKNAEKMEQVLLDGSKAGGLSAIKSSSHQFEFNGHGEGATAFVVLEESHFSVHTWPEHKYVAADIFTCGGEKQAKDAIAYVADKLGGKLFIGGRLPRGIPGKTSFNHMLRSPAAAVEDWEKETCADDKKNEKMKTSDEEKEKGEEGELVVEPIAEKWAKSLSDDDMNRAFSNTQHHFETMEKKKSKWQEVEFIRNKDNDDVCLVLDTTVQLCLSYNIQYSEVYVHLPVAYLNSFKSALIIGGGDAMALKEVLKYKSVERVVQLELDEVVPELSEKYFNVNAHLPGGPDTDPRVEWIFGDAAKTIVDLVNAGETFDLLLLDISETDPSGTVKTEDFFRHVSQALSPTGIFIKNENYQHATSKLFDEYLEVVYPCPMITQQTFVLGSNGTSLFLPHFSLLVENQVATSFLANGPASRFRQLQRLVRRYSKRGLDYEAQAAKEFQQRYDRDPWVFQEEIEQEEEQKQKEFELCVDGGGTVEECRKIVPCEEELADLKGAKSVHQDDWIFEACLTGPPLDFVHIELLNASPHDVEIAWLDPGANDEPVVVLPKLQPGESKRLKTYFGHQFAINEFEKTPVRLATFEVLQFHYSYRHVAFHGLHEGVYAYKDAPANAPPSSGPRSAP